MMAPVTFGSLVRGPAMSSLSRPLSPSAPLILRKNGVNMRRIAQLISYPPVPVAGNGETDLYVFRSRH